MHTKATLQTVANCSNRNSQDSSNTTKTKDKSEDVAYPHKHFLKESSHNVSVQK